MLPKRRVGSAGPPAFAAALCAVAVVGALAADARHGAAAQSHLEAEYVVTVSGIPIGRATWVVEISDKEYTAAGTGATTGLLRFFIGAHGTGASHGTIDGGQPIPTSYVATITDSHGIDDVRMALVGGNVKAYTVEPPLQPYPDRIPVSDADRRGVVDPMSSALMPVDGNGDPVSPQACRRDVPVFDGRIRYNLHGEFKRMDVVKADKGYEGPAVVCALYFTPVSGYVPERPAIKYLVELRDAEVWMAPIAGTRLLVPFRFSMPTPIGFGVVQATRFISAAKPAPAIAKTQ